MKTCSKCGVEKDLSEFVSDRRKKYGKGSSCKPCHNGLDWRRGGERPPEREGDADVSVLSLGAGVQSSCVFLMSCVGFLPKLDFAVFADTGWEPEAVYQHLDFLKGCGEKYGIPVHVVSGGDLRSDALDPDHKFASMPLYVQSPDGKAGMLRRQCTSEYKIHPVRSEVFRVAAKGSRKNVKNMLVDQWFGISTDEMGRMRDSDVLWIRHRYPLVDHGFSRDDCLRWMEENGFPRPERSACIGCPFHSDAEWLRIKANPEEWADAVDFDYRIRNGHPSDSGEHGEMFLHSSRKPLDEVVFSEQQDLFGSDCGGYCGV